MRIFNLLFIATSLFVSFGSLANEKANKSAVSFENPKEFRDIKASDESQKRFTSRLQNKLQDYIQKLSKKLPAGYSLNIVFTNIDLAGRVEYNFNMSREIRVVRQHDWPRLNFKAELLKDGNVIQNQDFELKDLAFMDRSIGRLSSGDTLRYEKRMLKEWFTRDKFFRI
ncbi:DUF3016 domain-containing protein [Psychrosphaera haliotis]|uniref:DUF3016 domain-containing protein n=1 Tax=Psychrosphaera haliotis TaxID=555083 RepID=A0A6N8FAV8_9GAMM|nr:DUF3016 domain-containing protein [Psychrosphaera haliotis]MUH73264.1 DUF3016 domain-containing protein [Psychrosphaera haliotis]